jgi:hypothetical protein
MTTITTAKDTATIIIITAITHKGKLPPLAAESVGTTRAVRGYYELIHYSMNTYRHTLMTYVDIQTFLGQSV